MAVPARNIACPLALKEFKLQDEVFEDFIQGMTCVDAERCFLLVVVQCVAQQSRVNVCVNSLNRLQDA